MKTKQFVKACRAINEKAVPACLAAFEHDKVKCAALKQIGSSATRRADRFQAHGFIPTEDDIVWLESLQEQLAQLLKQ